MANAINFNAGKGRADQVRALDLVLDLSGPLGADKMDASSYVEGVGLTLSTDLEAVIAQGLVGRVVDPRVSNIAVKFASFDFATRKVLLFDSHELDTELGDGDHSAITAAPLFIIGY